MAPAADKLFLGIDHTAIVVWDTDASLKFYRDLLGMHVAGESENYGTEQEHLNNVFGAHLRITALRAASGPGIELLEYLAPRDGRPFPTDEHASDVVHRQTIVSLEAPTPQLVNCKEPRKLCVFWRGRESNRTVGIQQSFCGTRS